MKHMWARGPHEERHHACAAWLYIGALPFQTHLRHSAWNATIIEDLYVQVPVTGPFDPRDIKVDVFSPTFDKIDFRPRHACYHASLAH
ncbi:MAG: hypothetical protein IH624_04040 [Phycisphaerae bacterium]|nr:hypothetical protein [Phycisphaerae bacterium]